MTATTVEHLVEVEGGTLEIAEPEYEGKRFTRTTVTTIEEDDT